MMLALEKVTGSKPVAVWHTETELPKVDLVVVPGGFSYGDYLRCGAIAARSPIMSDIRARSAKGLKVLGVCNGFQIITEAGLLPGALVRNAQLRFVCREVKTEGGEQRDLLHQPHGQGGHRLLPGGAWRGQLHLRRRDAEAPRRREVRSCSAMPRAAIPTAR